MYLGFKEMTHEKLRYALLSGILTLITLVVFVLAGLAEGLAVGNRQAVDDWKADQVYLNQDANQNLSASQLNLNGRQKIKAQQLAPLSFLSGTIQTNRKNLSITSSILATTRNSFIMPTITHGHGIQHPNQLIISDGLKKHGFKIGQTVKIGTNGKTVKIVGSYPKSTYSLAPTAYTDLVTMNRLKAGNSSTSSALINGWVARDSYFRTTHHGNLKQLSINDYINKLPGYSAQQLTLNTMIYFLFIIALAIIGIFMFILTLQKQPLFGVLKVQGIGTPHILAAILTQSILMSLIGIIVGTILTVGTASIIPTSLPFAINWLQLGLYSIALLIAAIIGALLSWRTVARIDPAVAIG